jgi:hypothetical protein
MPLQVALLALTLNLCYHLLFFRSGETLAGKSAAEGKEIQRSETGISEGS